VCALCLSLGAAGFALGDRDGKSTKSGEEGEDYTSFGAFLLGISILCDAVVPNVQESLMNHDHDRQKKDQDQDKGVDARSELMMYTNGIGVLQFLVLSIAVGEFPESCGYMREHPHVIFKLAILGASSYLGVSTFMRLIQLHGATVATLTSTLRKLATILLSFCLFPKALSWNYVWASVLVGTGMLLPMIARSKGCFSLSSDSSPKSAVFKV
jgi:drug/metabolite transporter (DMT)-like permease